MIVDYTVELLRKTHSEVYMTGQAKLLGQPEYHDVEKAQEVLTSLDEDVISNLPGDALFRHDADSGGPRERGEGTERFQRRHYEV